MAEPPTNPCLTCPHYVYVGCNLSPKDCISLEAVKKFAVAFAKFREAEISAHLKIG